MSPRRDTTTSAAAGTRGQRLRRRWALPMAAIAVVVVIGVLTWSSAGDGRSGPPAPSAPGWTLGETPGESSASPEPETAPPSSPDDEPTVVETSPSEPVEPSPGDEGDEETPGGPLRIPEPQRGPIGDRTTERPRVTQAVGSVIDAMDQIGQRGDGTAIGADLVATGFVLGEMEAFAQEQRDLGYRQVGRARIVSVEVVRSDLKADPPTMTVKVCVDVSEVDVLDASGRSLGTALHNPGHPVAHLYGAVFSDGVWKVATHDIPDVQDCASTEDEKER
ncbi:MAG TPA: hypothetical protein IAA98_07725 [Candidatus Avipropionibacterium avicola]|uniref:Uncharacterized protein n=1 Tax=Candidatus Avipropionibacterium avicola TaxID=2840701 RepID=A0A9D1GYG8_9ACTN|nr:hypothetical protein [Candidatus Avipropionibacterium avicola]